MRVQNRPKNDTARAPYLRQYPVRKLLFLGLHFGFVRLYIWAANTEAKEGVTGYVAKIKRSKAETKTNCSKK